MIYSNQGGRKGGREGGGGSTPPCCSHTEFPSRQGLAELCAAKPRVREGSQGGGERGLAGRQRRERPKRAPLCRRGSEQRDAPVSVPVAEHSSAPAVHPPKPTCIVPPAAACSWPRAGALTSAAAATSVPVGVGAEAVPPRIFLPRSCHAAGRNASPAVQTGDLRECGKRLHAHAYELVRHAPVIRLRRNGEQHMPSGVARRAVMQCGRGGRRLRRLRRLRRASSARGVASLAPRIGQPPGVSGQLWSAGRVQGARILSCASAMRRACSLRCACSVGGARV